MDPAPISTDSALWDEPSDAAYLRIVLVPFKQELPGRAQAGPQTEADPLASLRVASSPDCGTPRRGGGHHGSEAEE